MRMTCFSSFVRDLIYIVYRYHDAPWLCLESSLETRQVPEYRDENAHGPRGIQARCFGTTQYGRLTPAERIRR